MKCIRLIMLTIFLFSWGVAKADVMVLVHGYHGNPEDWRSSGIVSRLSGAGWIDVGVVFQAPNGELMLPRSAGRSDNSLYTVHLPSEYPLILQSQTLENYLMAISQANPDEKLIIVGHSAGGVVARSAVVRASQKLPIIQLITIASPHLGTQAAEIGALAARSPLAMVAPMVGAGTLNRSGQLFHDLQPEEPGTLLFTLNRQPHPRIEYISIVRQKTHGLPGDLLVSQESQHMEYVYALRGLARSVIAGFGHGLHVGDGDMILRLINGPRYL